MSRKTRADALFNRLKPAQRDELMHKLLNEGMSYSDAVEVCEDWGVRTSASAVSSFFSTHSCVWRIDQAKARAAATEKSLPKNATELTKRGLEQREFELAFSELTAKELIAFRRNELLEKRLQIDERRIATIEKKISNAARELEKAKSTEGGITKETLNRIEKELNLL